MSKASHARAKQKVRAKSSTTKAKVIKQPTVRPAVKAPVRKVASAELVPPEAELLVHQKVGGVANLQRWNVWLGIIFVAQAAAILLLSTTHDVTLTTSYLAPDPLLSTAGNIVLDGAITQLFQVNIAFIVALFLLVAGVGHIVAASVYRGRYEAELRQRLNRWRWLEYAATSSLLLLLLALLSGVYDISSLLMILVLSVTSYVLGLFLEVRAKTKVTDWTIRRIACVAGVTPWVVLTVYVLGTSIYGSTHLPHYLYWLYGSMIILFAGFAANFYLQYKARGRWADYVFGDRIYFVLSLLTKTALAWQIFAGMLHP